MVGGRRSGGGDCWGYNIPVDEEHYGHRWGEKRREDPQPTPKSVLGIRPPIHVLSEHGRHANPHGESDRMKVR